MGWKQVKEHYKIGHIVQVTNEGICIGSPYIHNIIVIGLDGTIKKDGTGTVNDDLCRYVADFKADLPWLRELITSPDKFEVSIPVYTYQGGEILEKYCEQVGWPNVTHDGEMQYENTFSTDKAKVVAWAKENARLSAKSFRGRIEDLGKTLAEVAGWALEAEANLAKLEKDYPSTISP